MRSEKPFSAGKPTFVVFMTLLVALAFAVQRSQAQTFKVLHTFHGPNGYGPGGVLVRDAAGNLFGTTEAGGTGKCGSSGCGTAFKLDKRGRQAWLHSFHGANGISPSAGLLRDVAGSFYGTAVEGGKSNHDECPGGCGVVFGLDKSGRETVLHKFTGDPDGYFPEALLVQDSAGNLYGTTYEGGKHGSGTVFKVDGAGKETVLHNFAGMPDGALPYPGVILDAAGNLYGVTSDGGTGTACDFGCGTVFEVDTAGEETILHDFQGDDGADPDSVLLLDSNGNLYGTTAGGGNSECGVSGCGLVFELSPHSDRSWTETVLYAFCSLSNCTDGERPGTGPLVRDANGNLYGTTIFGGRSRNCNGVGCGTVFELDASGKETVLYSFTDRVDGGFPLAGLVMDAAGSLYGAAQAGGDPSCTNGCGTIFRIRPLRSAISGTASSVTWAPR
jgi:uncharacterized repeat protein (TIGR03803 family)